VQFLNQYATAKVAKLSSWLLLIYKKRKEQRKEIIINIKLIHRARSVMKTEWKCYIKNYNFQTSQKTINNKYDYKVNFSLIGNSEEKKL